MKLATLRTGARDGALVVVSDDMSRQVLVTEIASTLQAALDDWERCGPALTQVYARLQAGDIAGSPFDVVQAAAPLPRAYQWLDGSAYLNHIELVRKSRGAAMPPSFWSDPIMYQGGSDTLLGAHDPIHVGDEAKWGADFEAEVAVILDDVAMCATPEQAAAAIRLIVLVNDISLRGLIPDELAKGFGFLHGKPPSAFSPVAVTPDELGGAWDGAKANLPLVVHLNGDRFGNPDAGKDMTFDFPSLIAHAAKTRPLGAGTIVGAGTVSNRDRTTGCCCISERRVHEILDDGEAVTPFLRSGDRVRIEMFRSDGRSVFGAIHQEVS
jgi:fumarylacetoacetate (FAA) hydrolase